MAEKFVKNVFLMLMGTIVALLLYRAFFGQHSGGIEWKGALMFAAEAIEQPISRYYFEYCFLPNIHSTDAIDRQLGCTVTTGTSSDLFSGIQLTDTSLDSEFILLPTSSYSSGWW